MISKRFYDTLDGRCRPVNNEFRSQYDRSSRKYTLIRWAAYLLSLAIWVLIGWAFMVMVS